MTRNACEWQPILRRTRWLWVGVGLTLLASSALAQTRGKPSPAVTAAEKSLRLGLKKGDLAQARQAAESLGQTEDAAAVDALLLGLRDLAKAEADIQRRLAPLTRKLEALDKRRAAAQGRRGRNAERALESIDRDVKQLQSDLRPLREDVLRCRAVRRSITRALARVLAAVDEEARHHWLGQFAKRLDAEKDRECRLVFLEVLVGSGDWPTVRTCLDAVAGDRDGAFRVRALDVLARHRIPGTSTLAMRWLEDPAWVLRAAAVEVLGTLEDLEAIPALLDVMEREDGRLAGDVQSILTVMTGVQYHDNVTLWRRWWSTAQDRYRKMSRGLESTDAVVHAAAMEEVAEAGFLLGARRILRSLGLVPGVAAGGLPVSADTSGDGPRNAPGGARAGGATAVESQRSTAREAVARALRNAHRSLQEDAIDKLVLRPMGQIAQAELRRELLDVLVEVRTPPALEALATIAAGRRFSRLLELEDRETAVRGLGASRSDAAILHLVGLFERPLYASTTVLVVEALAHIETHEAVAALVGLARLWGESNEFRAKGGEDLETALFAALARLTGEPLGADPDGWATWWREHHSGFQTRREREAQADLEVEVVREPHSTVSTFYGIETRSKRLCFVLDVSGSMNDPARSAGRTVAPGDAGRSKIAVATRELEATILGLPDDAYFTIIFYSSGYRVWEPRPVQATAEVKRAACEWVDGVRANGATNIFDPMAKAFELAGRGTFDSAYDVALDTIFFLSDGRPTTGLMRDPRRILEELLRLNELRRIQIHAIGVGRDHDVRFMRTLAERTGGVYCSR